MAVLLVSFAVMKITGSRVSSRLISRSTSIPDISGNFTSSKTRSGCCSATISSPAVAVAAALISTSESRKAARNMSGMARSSSTTRTDVMNSHAIGKWTGVHSSRQSPASPPIRQGNDIVGRFFYLKLQSTATQSSTDCLHLIGVCRLFRVIPGAGALSMARLLLCSTQSHVPSP